MISADLSCCHETARSHAQVHGRGHTPSSQVIPVLLTKQTVNVAHNNNENTTWKNNNIKIQFSDPQKLVNTDSEVALFLELLSVAPSWLVAGPFWAAEVCDCDCSDAKLTVLDSFSIFLWASFSSTCCLSLCGAEELYFCYRLHTQK